MRTTLTLEPDVAARLKALAHKRQLSFKAAVNTVLRRGLDAQDPGQPQEPFVLTPHDGGFVAGVDPARLNQLLDELDVDDFIEEARSGE